MQKTFSLDIPLPFIGKDGTITNANNPLCAFVNFNNNVVLSLSIITVTIFFPIKKAAIFTKRLIAMPTYNNFHPISLIK